MNRAMAGAVLTCILAASAALGADFWEKKKFTDWDDKDIRSLMADSPWCKSFTVTLKGFDGPGGGPAAGVEMSSSSGGGGRGGRGGGGGAPAGGMGGSSGTAVWMRWRSALPVRQAIARYSLLRQAPNAAAAADSLTRPMQYYAVEIEGLPAKAVPANPEEIKAHAELRVKKQPPVQPVEVRMELQGSAMAIYLLFPKGQPGTHEIELADGEVEVFLELAAGKVSKKFKLKDMMFGGKLEI